MSETTKNANKELDEFAQISYLAFVLGYDILHDMFMDGTTPDCDTAYDKCVELAKAFSHSEWDDEERPVYECLQDFVKDNPELLGLTKDGLAPKETKQYIVSYASHTGEDGYLCSEWHAADSKDEAVKMMAKLKGSIIEDCENEHGEGNWYSEQEGLRSFSLRSADGRDCWIIQMTEA